MKFTRQELEEKLLNNECDTVSQMVIENDLSYVHAIFYSGFKGYAHFTDEELIDEYKEQFGWGGEEIEIVNDCKE